MGIILRDDKLAAFIEKYELDCNSIIIKVNHKKKKACFIVDGKRKVNANYNELAEYTK